MTKMERRSLGASFYMCRMREYAFRGGIYNTYKLQRNKKLNFICIIIDIYEQLC